jgi:hypothetical protein
MIWGNRVLSSLQYSNANYKSMIHACDWYIPMIKHMLFVLRVRLQVQKGLCRAACGQWSVATPPRRCTVRCDAVRCVLLQYAATPRSIRCVLLQCAATPRSIVRVLQYAAAPTPIRHALALTLMCLHRVRACHNASAVRGLALGSYATSSSAPGHRAKRLWLCAPKMPPKPPIP